MTARKNTARKVPASEALKAETAVTTGTVTTTTDDTVRDMGTDNPAPVIADDGSNKGPILGDYHADAASTGEAVYRLNEMVKSMRGELRKVGTIFDQMAVAIADYGSFLTAKEGKIPDLKALKKAFLDVVNGRIYAEHNSETGDWTVATRSNVSAADEKGKGKKKSNAPKVINASEKFMGVATNTFNSYVDNACKAAILVLMSAAGISTTYRKGLRYSDQAKDHKLGEPVLFKMADGKTEYYIPWPLEGDAETPSNAYVGIIFNDHELHPFLEIEGAEGDARYLDKTAYTSTRNKPWAGLSIDGVKIHYARFVGDKTDDNGKPIPAEFVKETGLLKKQERETGGTQSEKNDDDKATAKITIVDMDKIGLVDFLKQACTVVRNLPKKDTAPVYTDEIRDLLAELNRLVDENVNERGEGEADETLDKAMSA